MIRSEVIRKRLNALDNYLDILEKLRQYRLEEFLESPERYGSAERFLQLAIETLTDMGNHVIAELSLGTVDHYHDVPTILAERGYLNQNQAKVWMRMIGFRNILVHTYLDIDRHIVYQVLQNQLSDIRELRLVFVQFL